MNGRLRSDGGEERSGEELEDPRCPECGGPVAMTATYCIHCSTDFSETGPVPGHETAAGGGPTHGASGTVGTVLTASGTPVEHPLDPDGIMDNTLTVIVGLLGGLIVGVVGTIVLLFLTENLWGVGFGLVVWLGATAYLVRRRYLLDAVAKTAYSIAIVLLFVPLLALVLDGGLLARGGIFVLLLLIVGIPAGIAAGIGWFASRYVPDDASVE